MRYVRCLKVWELLHNCLRLEVYGNFKYCTRYDELLIMMKITDKWDISIVHSCHINIAHNNVEYRLVRKPTMAHSQNRFGMLPAPPPKTATMPSPGQKVQINPWLTLVISWHDGCTTLSYGPHVVFIAMCMLHAAIWSTKHMDNTDGDKELTIKTTLRELIIYIIFLVILCISEFSFAWLIQSPVQSNMIWRAQVDPLCPHLKRQYIRPTYRLVDHRFQLSRTQKWHLG